MDKIAFELQKRLVQTCIDFINENMFVHKDVKKIYQVEFSADCLQESAEHGEWHPSTESYCAVYGEKPIDGYSTGLCEEYLIDENY
jgi:hypothetical protein